MTSTGTSQYRINLLDASNNVLDVARNIISVETVERLDSITKLVFAIPASDPKANLIGNPDVAAPALRFDVYHSDDGYIGRFFLTDVDIDDIDGQAVSVVNTLSELQQLENTISGFARDYSNTAIETIISDLLTSAGWTLAAITTGLNSSVTYQGQNLFEAIAELLGRWNLHFRMTSTASELEIGAFGTLNTSIRLTNLRGQDGGGHDSVALVKSLSRRTIFNSIYNRVIAVGAGRGAGMLVLNDGEVGSSYTVQSRTKTNGQDEFYIEDAASITAYGAREIVVIFDAIRPIANTATSKTQAQTELLANASAWLERYKDPRIAYSDVTVYGMADLLQVGDKVNLRYIEKATDGNDYINVDNDVWVTGITRRRTATGENSARLTLANTDRRVPDDTDIVAGLVKAVRSEKLIIQPEPFRFENTYYDTVQSVVGAAGKTARFLISIDETVTEITRVLIKFRTYTLESPTGAPNLQAHPSGGGGNYVNVTWGVNENSHGQYPRDISCTINGDNIDNDGDVDYITGGTGPWNPDPANAAVTVEMDITDKILNAGGGIYQDFRLNFTCEPTSVAQRVDYAGAVANSTGASQGRIELTVKIQGIAQAIYRD